jgi:hypothetical protein
LPRFFLASLEQRTLRVLALALEQLEVSEHGRVDIWRRVLVYGGLGGRHSGREPNIVLATSQLEVDVFSGRLPSLGSSRRLLHALRHVDWFNP